MDLTNTARKSPVGPHAPTFPLPASNYRNQPNDIWSAELNVRPTKVNICIPNSPRLLDSPQELGVGSCTFEAMQYSAYLFQLPPTPGMRLVLFKLNHRARQQMVLNRYRWSQPFPARSPNSFPSYLIPQFHVFKNN